MDKTTIETAAAEAIEAASLKIVSRKQFQFYSDVLTRTWTPDWSMPTAATNGSEIRYNPKFIADLTPGQLIFLIAHEVTHIKLGHHLRAVGRNQLRYNKAADYLVNDLLKKVADEQRFRVREPLELIDGCLIDKKYRADKHTEEYVYDRLADDEQDDDQPGSDGDDGSDDGDNNDDGQQGTSSAADDTNDDDAAGGTSSPQSSRDGNPDSFDGDIVQVTAPDGFDDLTPEQQQQARDEHEAKVRKDNAAQQMAGTMPGAVRDYFDATAAPSKDWRAVLADFCYSRARCSYDWMANDRRLLPYGIHLPDRGGVQIDTAVIAIDTSGSINRAQFERFLAETNAILADANAQEIIVIQCDSRVQDVQTYLDGDDIDTAIHGGGGTDFAPPFDYLSDHDIEPDFLLYFTDGFCNSYADEPDYPVLWVLPDRNDYFDPPYGEVIAMDEAQL